MPAVISDPKGYEKITVAGTSIACTVPAGGVDYALCRCETADVRWRDDGTAPTSTDGMLLAAGDVMDYDGQPEDLRFIRTTGVSGVVHVSYYNRGGA